MLRDYKNKHSKFKNSRFRKGIIATATAVCLVVGLSSVPVTQNDIAVVEAKTTKKDKKKPVITFSGKTKLTVEQNKSVKIPKTTAKDNKDGNVTKKLKVTVKKGTKSYSKIAKAIKSNKKVKFTATGKYVITYTVTDKAGNKATKKRYVTVVKKKVPTTEAPTTETPTEATAIDLSKYADIEKVTVNGITYNVAKSLKKDVSSIKNEDSYEFISNNYTKIDYYINVGIGENSKLKNSNPRDILLYFFGNVNLKINDVDYTKNIIFSQKQEVSENVYTLQLLVVDSGGDLIVVREGRITYLEYDKILNMFNFYTTPYEKICKDDLNEVALIPSPLKDTYEIEDVTLNLVPNE